MLLVLGLTVSNYVIVGMVLLFLLVSVALMLTILIQKPQGGGLSGAFGSGAGSGQTAFGAKTGDALTIATISMFAVWVIFALGLNYALTPADPTQETTATATDPSQTPPASGDGTETPSSTPPATPPTTTPPVTTPPPTTPPATTPPATTPPAEGGTPATPDSAPAQPPAAPTQNPAPAPTVPPQ